MTEFIDAETAAHIRAALTKRAKLKSASALRCGLEHVAAAEKCRAALPDRDTDLDEHNRVLAEMHAHTIAASQYFEVARNGAPPVAEDDDDDAAETDALTDPEVRATIETTRAAAAATLIAAGETHAAKRLVHKPTQPRR